MATPPGSLSRDGSGRRLAACTGAAIALIAAIFLGGCNPGQGVGLDLSGPTMGTYYSVKVPRPPAGLDGEALRTGIEGVLKGAVDLISTYEPDSELSRLNRNPSTDWVPVSPELYSILSEGLKLSELSGGAFDVTVGPLVNLWGFGPERRPEAVPPPESIRSALERVGYRKLELRESPPAVRKSRGDLYIDLSALGEGYGADRMAEWLESRGVEDYMAAVAGTMRVKGRNARGRPWGIAIERPTPEARAVQHIIPTTEGAVSTSGDYRNFFEEGGRRYSHHIDPRTGASVAHRLASVTVLMPREGDSATRADGLATALIVMGEEQGPALARSLDLAAYFIVRETQGFREIATDAFEKRESEASGSAPDRTPDPQADGETDRSPDRGSPAGRGSTQGSSGLQDPDGRRAPADPAGLRVPSTP